MKSREETQPETVGRSDLSLSACMSLWTMEIITLVFCYVVSLYRDLLCLVNNGSSSALKAKVSIFFLGKTKEIRVFSAFKFCFCLCQIFKSAESLIFCIKNRHTPFFLFWERVCTNQLNHPRSENVHMNVYSVFQLFFPPLNLCVWAMNTQHQGKYFYLHFKMSNPKQLGVHNRSALVILNIIEKWRERECLREMRDLVKRDRASEHMLEKETDRA